jgi:serine protease Do
LRRSQLAARENMSRLMFVYLSGTEKGKTRIFTQDHVTIGASDASDLKLVPEEGGSLPDGVLADVFNDDGTYHLVPRNTYLAIAVNGEPIQTEGSAIGHALRDGDTLQFGQGLSSVSLLFQVLPANFHATHLARRSDNALDAPSQRVHPLTATLFVKELTASLWAEIPLRFKLMALGLAALIFGLFVTYIIVSLVVLHRNTVGIESLRQQSATLAAQRQRDQDTIAKQQEEINRLREMSDQSRLFAQKIAERYSHGVCLIVGSYTFVERGSGRPLRYESADNAGEPIIDKSGNLLASINGAGPAVEVEFTGTGFIVEEGLIVTNKHVVQPWSADPTAQLIEQHGAGFRPRLESLKALFPSIRTPFDLKITRVSDRFDIALCSFEQGNAALPVLPLSRDDVHSIIGEPVVLLGYPTGVDGLLQRIEEGERREILAQHGRSAEDVAAGLAARGLVRPLTTTGTVSDALPTRIVHSAHTTEGGSGGPLFDRDGRVIAINMAVLVSTEGNQSFGGSNFGLPVKAVFELLAAYRQAQGR